VLLKLLLVPLAVQKECAAVNQLLHHVELRDVCRVVAGNEVCLVDKVGGLNRLLSEAEVRHGNTAGLLGVIVEVSLCIHIGVITDDLDGVLVRADGTVCAKTPELAVDGSFRSCDERFSPTGRDRFVTSSTMSMTKRCFSVLL
jgi:hypothetical protein